MTEADVVRIEAELGVAVPAHYREYVLAYTQRLRDAKFDYSGEAASDGFLFDDPQQVIDYNRGIREPGLQVTDGETGEWPDEFLIIGVDAAGNHWCAKMGDPSLAVWFFEHEEGVFEVQNQSLPDHERWVLQFIEEFNRGE